MQLLINKQLDMFSSSCRKGLNWLKIHTGPGLDIIYIICFGKQETFFSVSVYRDACMSW